VKWPNDVVVGGRKLAGLLADVSGGDMLLGVGLNVNNSPGRQSDQLDRPATGLAEEFGEPVSRRHLLFNWWDRFRPVARGESPPPPSKIESHLSTLGHRVRTEQGEGEAVGLRDDGGLVLASNGKEWVAHSSDTVEVKS
jgi:BirA family biotin operon repressor/biotin-[acetyl-CoA-carboxylase] ligase